MDKKGIKIAVTWQVSLHQLSHHDPCSLQGFLQFEKLTDRPIQKKVPRLFTHDEPFEACTFPNHLATP